MKKEKKKQFLWEGENQFSPLERQVQTGFTVSFHSSEGCKALFHEAAKSSNSEIKHTVGKYIPPSHKK